MKQEAWEARIRIAADQQMRLIDNDFVNFSILIEKYMDFCKSSTEDLGSRLNYWIELIEAEELR